MAFQKLNSLAQKDHIIINYYMNLLTILIFVSNERAPVLGKATSMNCKC